ncbi:TRAP transporter small permease [Chelatococcus asaccharovorans]|uniref:TRAP transporter small permease protein n=1 Tax=Chelatococcus asaccharovorans TaxID=28210 RepID=A0A2V3TTX7_9HYPH|nr:TRAP transporter small permease [Chelatococcus asaccharovorans]MBS7706170.1 TRAP transporter small permease [Chelatococcus asaccharovorans]PXW52546.1 TRAP-type C4-dicarboxylate transport system permease small subunit [Chelatococcus asaccharovorans]
MTDGKSAADAAAQPDAPSAFAQEIAAGQPLDLGSSDAVQHQDAPRRLWLPVSVEEATAAALMAILAVITLLNVVTRYLTNISFAFTEEYSVVLLFILVFVGVSSGIVKKSHISVTFFTDMLPEKGRKMAEFIGLLAMIACFVVLVIYGAGVAIDSYELEETSPGLGNPQWIYYATLPLLSALACLRALGAVIRLVTSRSENAP